MSKIIDFTAARERREALAMDSGVTLQELEQWDKLLLLADQAWSYRDSECLAELMNWVGFLSVKTAKEN